MKETRVQKYQAYRDSFNPKESESFITPLNENSLSTSQGLFLKITRQKLITNILIVSLMVAIIVAIIVSGILIL